MSSSSVPMLPRLCFSIAIILAIYLYVNIDNFDSAINSNSIPRQPILNTELIHSQEKVITQSSISENITTTHINDQDDTVVNAKDDVDTSISSNKNEDEKTLSNEIFEETIIEKKDDDAKAIEEHVSEEVHKESEPKQKLFLEVRYFAM